MTPLERAKADLQRMQKDLARLRAQVGVLEGQISRVEAYIEMAPVYESDDGQAENVRRSGGSGIAATSVRLSVEAIRNRGKRIHTRELLSLLQEQGITVGGSNPVANLSGFLSRSEELRNSRAEGWGLAEWPDSPIQKAVEHDISERVKEHQRATEELTAPGAAPIWEPAGDDLDDEISL